MSLPVFHQPRVRKALPDSEPSSARRPTAARKIAAGESSNTGGVRMIQSARPCRRCLSCVRSSGEKPARLTTQGAESGPDSQYVRLPLPARGKKGGAETADSPMKTPASKTDLAAARIRHEML